jgi:hypothetical protein
VSELRIVVAEGNPATRGRTVGRSLADMVERSLEFYHRYLDRRGVASPELQELLTPYLWAAENELPELMIYLKAMAEGATVPVLELFAVNAFEELEPLLEPEEGRPLFLRSGGPSGAPRSRWRCPATPSSATTSTGWRETSATWPW